MRAVALCVLALAALASAKIYYKETFDDGDAWTTRWKQSSWKKSDGTAGALKLTKGLWHGAVGPEGLQTSQDARFYAYTSKIDEPFDNEGKDLVLQFSVKHEQKIDCGGGYIKLLPEGTDQDAFSGDSEYAIMFGPDICGTSTRKIHVIFNYKGKNHLIKKEISAETDQLSHVYTLIVRPDNTYEVRVDGVKKESGSLEEDWDFLPPKTIKDPSVSKPADWVDEPMMDDPEDTKPADWDSIPKEIPDPDATMPEDWDEETDGEWEPAKIPNPEWKGEWKPKKIKNPAYKGVWVHPEIPNPDYVEDSQLYVQPKGKKFGFVGIDLWQVKAGSIFDNIIVTDSVKEAEQFLAETFTANKDAEKAAFDEAERIKREEEEAQRKKAEAERKAAEDEDDDDDDDEDDDDDDDDDEPKHKDEL